jgi:uncharacterized Zn-binding protein involved in type VI secretion
MEMHRIGSPCPGAITHHARPTTILDGLPANHLIRQGLDDLAHHRASVEACLVKIGSPKLRRCGVAIAASDEETLNADHELYALLSREHGNDAHRRYNALLRELVSFERALEARHRRTRTE